MRPRLPKASLGDAAAGIPMASGASFDCLSVSTHTVLTESMTVTGHFLLFFNPEISSDTSFRGQKDSATFHNKTPTIGRKATHLRLVREFNVHGMPCTQPVRLKTHGSCSLTALAAL